MQLQHSSDGQTVQTVQMSDMGHHDGSGELVDLNTVAQAALGQEGQIILTGRID